MQTFVVILMRTFAVDTICISENAESLTKLLHCIQEEGAKYGLQLNLNKCEILRISRDQPFTNTDKVTFRDGSEVKTVSEAKYLV